MVSICMLVLLSMQVAGTAAVGLLPLLPLIAQVVHPSYRDPNGVLESQQEELQSYSQYLRCSFIKQTSLLVLFYHHAFM